MVDKLKKVKAKNDGDIASCRVIEIGIGNFAECAQWGPIQCDHAMPFGGSFLCLHPRVDDIIENTTKALSAEKL